MMTSSTFPSTVDSIKSQSTTKTDASRASASVLIPSKISRLSALATSDEESDDIRRVGNFLRQGSLAAVIMWLVLLAVVWFVAPSDSYQMLQGPERNACIMVFVLLAVTNGSRLLPLLLRDSTQFIKTGAMVGSCTVQCIALLSVALLIFCPTPVIMDPITHRRVHLVRWAEWTPLAFLMTFLTEGIDMPNRSSASSQQHAWMHAVAIALSTSAGLVFPFCTSLTIWLLVFVVSCILFTSLYIRLYQRSQRFRLTSRGTTVDEQENYDRIRLSLRLLQACAIMWTLLVLGFILACLSPSQVVLLQSVQQEKELPFYYTWWADESFPLVLENVFEVGSKVWYLMLILDVHELVFDEGSRAVRRLEEMRDIMSVVWDSSSDVIALCVKGKRNAINAVVSPMFLKLSGEETQQEENIALVFEVMPPPPSSSDSDGKRSTKASPTPKHKVAAMNLSSPVTQRTIKRSTFLKNAQRNTTMKKTIASMAKLIAKSWQYNNNGEKESLFMHELYGPSSATENEDDGERAIQCEAKITSLDDNAVVIVVRDISERFQRFEAEKQLVIEVTERKKDAEANRFTRHEVKNGLLAAIGLVDSMREQSSLGGGGSGDVGGTGTGSTSSAFADYMANRARSYPQFSEVPSTNQHLPIPRNTSDLSLTSSDGGGGGSDDGTRRLSTTNFAQSLLELDCTLREILDTVLSEAMARDVVHEVYEPRKERINVASVLYGRREPSSSSTERFPLHSVPSPFPQLLLDPQLLRYIHRNAVSNACKYGADGGQVKTEMYFDSDKQEFQMKVINLPGDRHQDLVKLDEQAVKTVFAAGTRLHESLDGSFGSLNEALISSSAGDGAWIMQKCAVTLGGQCKIEFQEEQTVFSLTCPANAVYPKEQQALDDSKSTRFRLPEDTWGVAIDDSGIQRKLLGRFLSLAGVDKSKRKIMGKDADEVLGFNRYLQETIEAHPNDRFLVIVDENLDILDGGAHQKTVSGSLCVKLLREQMKPEDECRLLALVRSANDSSEDVALYKSRAHGFLPKAPIQKDGVLDLIQPWWAERFPMDSERLARVPSLQEDDEQQDVDELQQTLQVSSVDLMKSVEVIDALVLDEAALEARWPAIREKIHALKGDLKTMKSNARVTTILEALQKLRGRSLPDEFLERWKLIRSLIVSIL